MKLNKLLIVLGLAGMVFAGEAFAQTPQVSITTSALQEVTTKDQAGKEQKTLKNVEKTEPGEQIVFKNEISNNSQKPATNIVVTNPVPEHMYFVDSFNKDQSVDTTYSADNGKTFGKSGTIQVTDEATHTQRAARPEEYTNIRWTLTHALAAGSKTEVGFKANVK